MLKIITITNNSTNKKKIIFFTNRVHPGEPVCSFILEGIINFLLSDNIIAY